jgi:hypothetical protein
MADPTVIKVNVPGIVSAARVPITSAPGVAQIRTIQVGPQGPQGETGATGETGPQGPTGASGSSGSGGASFSLRTSVYTAVSGDRIMADTTSGGFTITLPASPTNGDFIEVADARGTWGTNNLTIAAGGTTAANSGWSASDHSANINISNNGRTAQCVASGSNAIARGTEGKGSGKAYFEIECDFMLGSPAIGIANATQSLTGQYLGQTTNNASFANQVDTFTLASVVRFAIDITNNLYWFAEGANDWNSDAGADPAAGTNGLTYTVTAPIYPAVYMNSSHDAFTLATQAADFASSIPSGFSAWSTSGTTVPTAIGGVNSSLVCNMPGRDFGLVYIGGTIGWQIVGL